VCHNLNLPSTWRLWPLRYQTNVQCTQPFISHCMFRLSQDGLRMHRNTSTDWAENISYVNQHQQSQHISVVLQQCVLPDWLHQQPCTKITTILTVTWIHINFQQMYDKVHSLIKVHTFPWTFPPKADLAWYTIMVTSPYTAVLSNIDAFFSSASNPLQISNINTNMQLDITNFQRTINLRITS